LPDPSLIAGLAKIAALISYDEKVVWQGAGLRFIDRRPAQNLRTEGLGCSKSAKKISLIA